MERLGDAQAGPGLFEMLKSSNNWHHKKRVFQALKKIGWQPQSADEKLVYYFTGADCLGSEEWSELVTIGHLTVPKLLELLKDILPGALGVGESARERIVVALGQIGDAQAAPALLEVFTSSPDYSSMHKKAIEALQKIGDTQVVSGLIEALVNGNSSTQIDAARVLGQIGDAQAVPSLLEALKDGFFGLQESIVKALGAIGDARAIPALTEMLKDAEWRLREAAQLALDCINKK